MIDNELLNDVNESYGNVLTLQMSQRLLETETGSLHQGGRFFGSPVKDVTG